MRRRGFDSGMTAAVLSLTFVSSVPVLFGAVSSYADVVLSDEQKAAFGVVNVVSVPAITSLPTTDGSPTAVPLITTLPAYTFIQGCHDCGGATYDSSGNLISLGLQRIPTSYILRVPANWNGKMVVQIPSGTTTQTIFPPFMQRLMEKGFAVAEMNHPSPGFSINPYDEFIEPPYHAQDFPNAYFATGHLLRDLITQVFGTPVATYGLGYSRGGLLGTELVASRMGGPFDGYVMIAAGDGRLAQLNSYIHALKTGKIPLTDHPFSDATVNLSRVITFIGEVDSEYRDLALSKPALALDYDVSTRPAEVRRALAYLEPSGNIQKPVIFVQGLHDGVVFAANAINYATKISKAGKGDLLRLYLFKWMGHGGASTPVPPNDLFANAIDTLDAWAQSGIEPGPFTVTLTGGPHAAGNGTFTRLSTKAQGFADTAEGIMDAFTSELNSDSLGFPDAIVTAK